MPYKDTGRALETVFKNFKKIPFWPQLPKSSFKENMYVQFSANFPGRVIDEKNETIHFDLDGLHEKAGTFYEKYISEDTDYFKISKDHAAGLYALLDTLKEKEALKERIAVKGHITGPVSFGLAVNDQDKKPVLYNELFKDIMVKGLSRKAAWQEKTLRGSSQNTDVIIFIDEPYLMSFGSGFVSLQREEVISMLKEIIGSLSCTTGIHCCGNTDWSLFPEAGIDIISFDAYDYTENLALYLDSLKGFLENGGILAWGIVPTSFPDPEIIDSEDLESLSDKLDERIRILTGKGIELELLAGQSLITPNCGAGSLSEKKAEKIFKLTKELSDRFRKKFEKYISKYEE